MEPVSPMRREVEPVELETPRLRLLPYRDAFAPELYTAARESIATVGRWMPWCHAQYEPSDSLEWARHAQSAWKEGGEYAFALFDRDGRFVGGAGINQIHALHNFANLGYWIRESRQRQGFATEAVRAVAAFAFGTLGLTRVEIVAAEANEASRRVALKAGAAFECLARNRLVIRGVPHRSAVHSLVPDDLR
jgi:ribosomal-protein-serine acetyltransferase